jgi:hypothetical protein
MNDYRFGLILPDLPESCYFFVDKYISICQIDIVCKGKSKPITVQAWTGLVGSRRLRLPVFKTIGT